MSGFPAVRESAGDLTAWLQFLLGALGSLVSAFQISDRDYPGRAAVAMIPWSLLIVALTTAALWIMSQPMEMTVGCLG